jgi:hypothetical protein
VVLDPTIMIILHNPKKKATNYVAKITDDSGKSIRMKIVNCKPLYLREQPSGGHLLRIILPKDSEQYQEIQKVDESICKNAIVNNNKWFNNNLKEDEINEFFRPSLNTEQDTMTVMISDIHDIIITLNDTVIDTLDKIDLKNPHIDISLEIEAQGLYFFPKKFGIRWIVHKLAIHNSDLLASENSADIETLIDKNEIENAWECEVQNIQEFIKQDISKYIDKIESIKKYSNEINEIFEKAKNANAMEEWNSELIKLSHKIAKYSGGITTADIQ